MSTTFTIHAHRPADNSVGTETFTSGNLTQRRFGELVTTLTNAKWTISDIEVQKLSVELSAAFGAVA